MTHSNRSKLIAAVTVAACIITVPAIAAAAVARPHGASSLYSLNASNLLLGWWNTLVNLATGAEAPAAPAGARIDGNGSSDTLGTVPEEPLNDAGARIDGNGAR